MSEEYEAMRSRMAERGTVILLPEEVERRACAEMVRAAGCRCGGGVGGDPSDIDEGDILVSAVDGWHSEWCPVALAAAIEKRGQN